MGGGGGGVMSVCVCVCSKGRGCMDMIFCANELIEKTIEHEASLYVIFVDLRKAYDSVPRCGRHWASMVYHLEW